MPKKKKKRKKREKLPPVLFLTYRTSPPAEAPITCAGGGGGGFFIHTVPYLFDRYKRWGKFLGRGLNGVLELVRQNHHLYLFNFFKKRPILLKPLFSPHLCT